MAGHAHARGIRPDGVILAGDGRVIASPGLLQRAFLDQWRGEARRSEFTISPDSWVLGPVEAGGLDATWCVEFRDGLIRKASVCDWSVASLQRFGGPGAQIGSDGQEVPAPWSAGNEGARALAAWVGATLGGPDETDSEPWFRAAWRREWGTVEVCHRGTHTRDLGVWVAYS